MVPLLLVMSGGAIGAGARHLVGHALLAWLGIAFPFGTLGVNLIGGLLMGVLAGMLLRVGTAGQAPGETWRLFLGVGVLGGFTTFSSFALDTVALAQRGAVLTAAVYVLASVAGSIAALLAGLALTRVAA